MGDALYGCYLRVGDPGPWAGPWAGIARLEMPSGIGRAAAVEAAERAAGWLPRFASALHRDARAPVNLTPIAGLERHLHRLQGGRTTRLARGARGGARTQPRRTDGMIADCRPPAHREPSATSNQRDPFAHDNRTAAPRRRKLLRGSPGVRPRTRAPSRDHGVPLIGNAAERGELGQARRGRRAVRPVDRLAATTSDQDRTDPFRRAVHRTPPQHLASRQHRCYHHLWGVRSSPPASGAR